MREYPVLRLTAGAVGRFDGLRILDKIRVTEEERNSSKMEVADGQLRWQIPSQDFGSSQVMLEDQEARRLADLLDSWPKVTIRDAACVERVVSDLKSERSATAEGVQKNARRKG